jgi:hypothetical protein
MYFGSVARSAKPGDFCKTRGFALTVRGLTQAIGSKHVQIKKREPKGVDLFLASPGNNT